MRAQCRSHCTRERIAINGKRATGRKTVLLGHLHDQPTSRAHFPMQQANGVPLMIVRTERVRAHHLGEVAGAVREGAHVGAHFVKHDGHACLSRLPGSLGSGHAAANDV